MPLRALLVKADAIPERTILWVDLALAGFVGLAHGGALAITYVEPTPNTSSIRLLASISLPAVAVLATSGIAGLLRQSLRRTALAVHGVILALGSLATVLWAATLLIDQIPEGNFSWSPGFMSAIVTYGIFVFSRFGVPTDMRARSAFFYAPVAALLVSVPIDLAVFTQFVSEFGRRF
jgi:hypothetical protein